jgi:hypothetical protein
MSEAQVQLLFRLGLLAAIVSTVVFGQSFIAFLLCIGLAFTAL